MRLLTYLNYGGNCREAFEFYEQRLDGRIIMMTIHGAAPNAGDVPEGLRNKVLHARLELGGTQIFGTDVAPDQFQPMRSAYLTLMLDSVDDAERIYAILGEEGQIFMPMAQTFFAKRFAMLRDRFGTSWMLLHETTDAQTTSG